MVTRSGLLAEKVGFLGFGGNFGVVSPGEKLGDVFELALRLIGGAAGTA